MVFKNKKPIPLVEWKTRQTQTLDFVGSTPTGGTEELNNNQNKKRIIWQEQV